MKAKKPKREVHRWLRDASMSVLPGDELLDKHLTFPRRRRDWGPIVAGGRCRLVENGKETFNIEWSQELNPVIKRLTEALVQEQLLIERIRELVDRPRKGKGAKRPNTKEILVLETALSLGDKKASSKVSLSIWLA
jgi:hypothetical protein